MGAWQGVVQFENGKAVEGGETKQGWMEGPRRLQTSPEVPVVPFMNRRRRYQGRSELRTLKPIVDATNQIASN